MPDLSDHALKMLGGIEAREADTMPCLPQGGREVTQREVLLPLRTHQDDVHGPPPLARHCCRLDAAQPREVPRDAHEKGTDPGAYPNLTALNLRICSVRAVSTGRRSMLEAP